MHTTLTCVRLARLNNLFLLVIPLTTNTAKRCCHNSPLNLNAFEHESNAEEKHENIAEEKEEEGQNKNMEKKLCQRLDTLIDERITTSSLHRSGKKGTSFKFDSNLSGPEKVYNIVMKFYTKTDMLEMALDKCGVKATPELVVQVLKQLGGAGNPAYNFFVWAGKQSGYMHTQEVYNAIINVVGKMNQFGRVWAILEEMRERDPSLITPHTFVIMVRRFAAAKMVRKAIDVLDEMPKFGREADEHIFGCLLDALCKHNKVREALQLFTDMKLRFKPNLKNYSIMLNGLCKEGMLEEAHFLMGEMLGLEFGPDLAAYNTLLHGYAKAGKIQEAFDFLNEMKKRGCVPNAISYTSLIHALCEAQRLEEAYRLLKDMTRYGCFPDVVSYTALIGGLCKWGKLDEAYKVLDEMTQEGCAPNQMTYSFLLRQHEKREERKEALQLVQEMSENGCDPDLGTYTTLLRLCCNLDQINEAWAIWRKMEREGISADLHTYTVFIHGLIKQKNLTDACTYYKEMVGKGLVPAPQYGTLKVLLNGLLRLGKLEMAVDIWDCMRKSGSHINLFAYTIWIQALCQIGEVKEAAAYCADMIDDGLLPQPSTYQMIKKGLRKLYNRRIGDEIRERLRLMIRERNLNFKSYVKEGIRKEAETRISRKCGGRKNLK